MALAVDRATPVAVKPAAILAVVAFGQLLANWAMNPVSSILPSIQADLHVDVTWAAWIMNAYFVLLVGWVLTAGRVGDAIGHGKVFRLGCLTFAAGALVCCLPGGFALAITGRAIQGLGSAMIFGTSLATIAAVSPGPRLAWAVGVMTTAAGVASLVGTWVSTQIVQVTTWHWAFVLPVAIGLGTAIAAGGKLPNTQRSALRDVDWLGGALLFGSAALLLLGLAHLHSGPETFSAGAPYHVSMHLSAAFLLSLFLWRQFTAAKPLIDLRQFRNFTLSAGVLANGVAHSSMLATNLLIPYLLERGRGYSPTYTAELLTVMQACGIVASLTAGMLYTRWRTPWIGIGSMGLVAAGLFVLGRIGADLPFVWLFPISGGMGIGLMAFTAVNNTAVVGSVGAEHRGFGSGMLEMTRQLGHSLGVSASSAILAANLTAVSLPGAAIERAQVAIPSLGYRNGFAEAASAMAVWSFLGLLVVLFAATWSRRHPAPRIGVPPALQPAG